MLRLRHDDELRKDGILSRAGAALKKLGVNIVNYYMFTSNGGFLLSLSLGVNIVKLYMFDCAPVAFSEHIHYLCLQPQQVAIYPHPSIGKAYVGTSMGIVKSSTFSLSQKPC